MKSKLRHYQLLRKIDPTAANNATADITGVFGALCKRIGSKPSGSGELLKLLRLSRNTYHNNGVFYSEKQTDDEVIYKARPITSRTPSQLIF